MAEIGERRNIIRTDQSLGKHPPHTFIQGIESRSRERNSEACTVAAVFDPLHRFRIGNYFIPQLFCPAPASDVQGVRQKVLDSREPFEHGLPASWQCDDERLREKPGCGSA